MPNIGKFWSKQELEQLAKDYENRPLGITDREWSREYGKKIGKSDNGIRGMVQRLQMDGKIKTGRLEESPYIQYNQPLECEGDALILCDLEAPFQDSDFVNRCLDVASRWGIQNCILAGDAVHFDALSQHAPNWIENAGANGKLGRDLRDEFWKLAQSMSGKARKVLEDKILEMGEKKEQDDPDKEIAVARSVLHRLGDQFDLVMWALGNHEGRALAQAQRQLAPNTLIDEFQLNAGKWHIAPYYFAILYSGNQVWRVTHPVTLSDKTSVDFAAMHQCNIIHAHTHSYFKKVDISGKFLAIQPGCCVDESRLAYAAQRDRTTRVHILGACIVRDGYLWELNRFTDWDRL